MQTRALGSFVSDFTFQDDLTYMYMSNEELRGASGA